MVSTDRIAAWRLSTTSAGRKSPGCAWLGTVSWVWRWSDIVAPICIRGRHACRASRCRCCTRDGREGRVRRRRELGRWGRWVCSFGGALGLGVLDANTLAGHLEDDRVVDEPIDRGGGGHR